MAFEVMEIAGVSFSALRAENPALCGGPSGGLLDLSRDLRKTWMDHAEMARTSGLRQPRTPARAFRVRARARET
jgi:hypothetical protein